MASVSLTRNERYKIKEVVIEQYKKLIMSFNENSDIRREITIELLNDSFEKLTNIPDNAYKYLCTVAKDRVSSVLTSIKLPTHVLEFDSGETTFLAKQDRLFVVPFEDNSLNFPQVFKDNNVMPMLLIDFMVTNDYSNYDKNTVSLSNEQITRMETHNAEISSKVATYIEQLGILKATIEKCKSTKMFEANLPALVNLYPKSVTAKLAKKNNKTKELSEKELAIQGAINSFAAASLIEDTSDN